MTPVADRDATPADILAQRLPALAAACTLYGRLDTDADTQYQMASLLLELSRRVAELERREQERDGDGR